ncbi:polysaccharide export protein [Caulobacter vibrioides]|nr:polysaccharide biosynthesis/export family protein [Caulobacter vibrioides]YP_002517887.1 polysaccharide secretin protein hfsD [Caulobacter vibrioides NA1000]ACL95979.1 polysaccharide secretin protein hfsD [Caulobacter vibrioides NA1000]ATC25423.1 polysaccharide export protein [Caulobacter vibrioides]ATC29286.1 polysaccharide export protein [Caulobacter vibrioides]AZH13515.1 polysaccharide export protein [Caulobacter vibrioides]PLR14383.1 polysaccharide export protein [Caulobacter vibrioide
MQSRTHFMTALAVVLMAGGTTACGHLDAEPITPAPRPTATFSNIGYADWSEAEPDYRFYPGDEIEMTVPSAPELNKTATVQPDGRITVPLVQPVMAADRTIGELQASLSQAYAGTLLRPQVQISVKATAPLKVFVGGEVGNPGVFDMAGDGDALRAIIQAGGFKTTAKRNQVVIIRRGPDGRAMMRTADLLRGLTSPGGADLVPLRRFDIVYVPRSGAAETGLFMQQYFRDLLPVSFSYAINGNIR